MVKYFNNASFIEGLAQRNEVPRANQTITIILVIASIAVVGTSIYLYYRTNHYQNLVKILQDKRNETATNAKPTTDKSLQSDVITPGPNKVEILKDKIAENT